jgi:hypothetical protein
MDMAAYMINCVYLIQFALALYQFTGTQLEMLQAQVIIVTMIKITCIMALIEKFTTVKPVKSPTP